MIEGKLSQLVVRVDQLIERMETLKQENQALKSESNRLRLELSDIQDQLINLELKNADQSQAVKSRLTSVLSRLKELEQIG